MGIDVTPKPPASDHADLEGTKWRLSSQVAVETVAENEVVIFHSATCARLKISPPLYSFLQRFRRPATLAEAYGADPDERLRRQALLLVSKGFLIDDRAPFTPLSERRLSAVPHGLFNCPLVGPGGRPAQVSVLGVPHDLATHAAPGMRDAPSEVRTRSLDFKYKLDFATGRPEGWFDVDREERILEGVSFCDWGNAFVQPGEDQRRLFQRVGAICREIVEAGSFPLMLGGDHSCTFPVVEAIQRDRRLCVVYLDPHTDFDLSIPEEIINHKSVGLRLSRLPGVEKVVQIGHRGYTVSNKVDAPPDGFEIVTAQRWRKDGARAALEALPADLPCYVSIDINVLDPVYSPGASHPTPGGFRPDEVKEILRSIGENRRTLGMDVVEFNPARDVGSLTAIHVCHLILAGMGAAMSNPANRTAEGG